MQTIEVPLLQFINKVVEDPVVVQRQVHVNRNVQKTTDIHQLQCSDDVVDVPVVLVVQSPLVHLAAETAEISQLPLSEKIVAIPKVRTVRGTKTSESFTAAGNRDHETFMRGVVQNTEFDCFIDAEAQVATHSFKRETDLGFHTRPVLET